MARNSRARPVGRRPFILACISLASSLVVVHAEAHSLGDLVFCDKNGNGIFEPPDDVGIPGVTVLRNCTGFSPASVITDANGRYVFVNSGSSGITCTVAVDTSSPPVAGKAITTPLLGVRPTSNSNAAEHTPFPSFGCGSCPNAFVTSVMADGVYKTDINNLCSCVDPGCTTDPCPSPTPFVGYYGDDFGFVCAPPATTTTTITVVTTTTSTSTTASTAPEPPVTTTTTSTTSSSTTIETTTTTTTTTTTVCVPTPEAGHCGDMIDNDCNNLIDCSDAACQPATCQGGTQNGLSCSSTVLQSACTDGGGTCICPFIRGDPTYIRFGLPGAGMDQITSHGRVIVPGPPLDVPGSEVAWLLSDANGKIFSVVLPRGSLKPDQSGKLFRYKNPDAKLTGGVYTAAIRVRRVGASYGYRFQAYGDLSGAKDPDMDLQFYVGGQPTSAIHSETWQKKSYGWRARGFDR